MGLAFVTPMPDGLQLYRNLLSLRSDTHDGGGVVGLYWSGRAPSWAEQIKRSEVAIVLHRECSASFQPNWRLSKSRGSRSIWAICRRSI